LGPDSPALPVNVLGRNNLFHNGSLTLRQPYVPTTWGFYDNAFDGVNLTQNTNNIPNGFNCYVNATRLLPNSVNEVVLTNFTYQTGPLGAFYQGQTNLANVGSQAANLSGLFHYTTTINQVKETNSVVDIGYHLVALNAQNAPVDSDGDGSADYIEDRNGNGAVDSGETDWQSAWDPGLRVFITEPKKNAKIP
jgi:hypothetical protein